MENILLSHGVRPTSNRILVLRTLMESDRPLSIKDFVSLIVSLDKSSIFRCLRYFAKHHLIHEIEDGSGALKYEFCHAEHTEEHSDMHPHFYCKSCKRTICLTDIPLPIIALEDGSIIHSANYVIKGICAKCAQE
jgi:Fur family ferric uptake transcriptional regulator